MESNKPEDEALFYGNDKVAYKNTTTSKNGTPLNGSGDAVECNGIGKSPKRARKCTKKRALKICLLSTFVPILVLGAAVGIYLLYQRLTYNPPPSQYSNITSLSLFFDTYNNATYNGTNSTGADPSAASSALQLVQGMVSAPYTNCDASSLATIQGFFIDECLPYDGEKGRCALPLERDGNIRVFFEMKPDINVAAPTFDACGKAIYTGTPCRNQPFSKPDPCVDSGLTCPLEGGKLYAYHNYGGVHQKDLPITLSFDTYADIYFRLRDPVTKKLVFCVRMPAVIDLEPFGS